MFLFSIFIIYVEVRDFFNYGDLAHLKYFVFNSSWNWEKGIKWNDKKKDDSKEICASRIVRVL